MAVEYDLDEICTGCSQISGISFGGKIAFEMPIVLGQICRKNAKNCFFAPATWSPKD